MKTPFVRPRSAFTLIELLVVMGIIVLMGALVVPAVSGTLKGTALNQAAQTLQGQFNNAQQVALAKGLPIEMRIFMCADPESPTADKEDTTQFKVRGLQLYSIQPNQDPITVATVKQKFTAVSKLEFLPSTIIIDSNKALSTLCDKDNLKLFRDKAQTEDYLHPKLARIGLNYQYFHIQFRPDGRTDLNPNSSWYLTMHDLTKGDNLTLPPSNFFTLSLDAVQGSTRAFRPM